MLRPHQNLDAWQQAMRLVKMAYLVTQGFPKEELYGLTAQMRRAAVSIPSNLDRVGQLLSGLHRNIAR